MPISFQSLQQEFVDEDNTAERNSNRTSTVNLQQLFTLQRMAYVPTSDETKQSKLRREKTYYANIRTVLSNPMPELPSSWFNAAIELNPADPKWYIFAIGLGACLNVYLAIALQFIFDQVQDIGNIKYHDKDTRFTELQVRLDLVEYLQAMKKNGKHGDC
jgi:hypothetical protein